jgi:2-keto-4-pentenoate hydratase/2-oxohepta-3-ene-1,7-dioic acid hydratase in catechol pathway
MKIVTFQSAEGLRLGVKTDKGIIDIAQALKVIPADEKVEITVEDFLNAGKKGLCSLKDYVRKVEQENPPGLFLNEENVKLGPCVPKPGKIIGIGLNYHGYMKITNTPLPNFPYLFTKFPTSVRASGDPVLIPFNSDQVDYEAELAVVIGKKARNITPEEALDYVGGYCNTNDFSARDIQYSNPSWLPGKCGDSFCPIGPYLVTPDEVGDPNNLTLRAYLNGKIVQDSNTSDMILSCREVISGISKFFTLEPGDIILTGCPEGIIMTWPEEKREIGRAHV